MVHCNLFVITVLDKTESGFFIIILLKYLKENNFYENRTAATAGNVQTRI
jgi:hypothetical protein